MNRAEKEMLKKRTAEREGLSGVHFKQCPAGTLNHTCLH